jgi:hypothetical protein
MDLTADDLNARHHDYVKTPQSEDDGLYERILAREGTPFLLSPDEVQTDAGSGEEDLKGVQATDTESPSTTTEATTPTSAVHTKTTQSSSSETTIANTAPSSSLSPTQSPSSSVIPTTTSTSPAAAFAPTTVDGTPSPVQLSSLAYLVPVFLLIFITIGAIIYRRYRARKRIDRESSTTFQSPPPLAKTKKGWKEIKDDDINDKEGIWNDDSDPEEEADLDRQWRDVYVKESKSRPGLLDVSTAGGWLRSSAWKSARSVHEVGDQVREGKTVKLVTRSIPTYESLLPGQNTMADNGGNPGPSPGQGGKYGSLKAIRDSISSLSLNPMARKLERSKSPNKQRPIRPPPPPEEPAWIRPRAASPVNILSPPSQPHFFFQPTPPQSMVMHRAQVSESEYSVAETESESLLSSAPSRQTRLELADQPTINEEMPIVDLDRTPTQSRPGTTVTKPTHHISPSKTPVGMRRSSASRDLARSPSKRTKQRNTLSPNAQMTPSVRKRKKQLKDDKARQRVESILQASWSDRALSSPSASMDSLSSPPGPGRLNRPGQVPGWASPGVDQVGGIQARLAMLRQLEN